MIHYEIQKVKCTLKDKLCAIMWLAHIYTTKDEYMIIEQLATINRFLCCEVHEWIVDEMTADDSERTSGVIFNTKIYK